MPRRRAVDKWRKRFAASRLDGLVERARPGRPKVELVLSEEERAQLVAAGEVVAGVGVAGVGCAGVRGWGSNKQVATRLRVAGNTVKRHYRVSTQFIELVSTGSLERLAPRANSCGTWGSGELRKATACS